MILKQKLGSSKSLPNKLLYDLSLPSLSCKGKACLRKKHAQKKNAVILRSQVMKQEAHDDFKSVANDSAVKAINKADTVPSKI